MNIADVRQEYMRASLDDRDLAADPYLQFDRWFSDAVAARMPMLNAMTLATVAASGRPSARIVLLKGVDARGFVFYTIINRAKALSSRPTALQRCSFTGQSSNAKCASKEPSKKFQHASRTNTLRAGLWQAAMRRLLHRKAKSWKIVPHLKHVLLRPSDNSAPIRRGLHTGAAIGWFLMPSNSGRDARTACTTVCSTPAQRAGGRSRGSLHSRRSHSALMRLTAPANCHRIGA
jgi:hypothetical protein